MNDRISGRGYALLSVKALEEGGKRIVRGMATTPAVDRVGDTIDPMGVKFGREMPFLWQHNHDEPIGWVKFGKPTKDGIPFEAEVAQTDEPGALKDFLDKCWQTIRLGLVKAVSIGFRAIKWAWIGDYDGIEYQEIEVFELSAVTIPANQEALITEVSNAKGVEPLLSVIKSFDEGAPAASGRPRRPSQESPPGVTGKSTKPVSLTPKEGRTMNIAEQIAALEAKRAATASRLEEIQSKAASENRTKDAAEREEFDNLKAELKTLDEELADLRDLATLKANTAKPVEKNVQTPEAGARERDATSPRAEVRLKKKEAPGILFARAAKIRAFGQLERIDDVRAAERLYGANSDIVAAVKAAVVAGSTASGNWAAALVGDETTAFADFAEYLRPATILGKFGQGGIPALRSVPFREALISQTGGGAGYWVGEAKPIPLTAGSFARTSLTPLKVGNIAVVTLENIKSSNPSSELIIRDSLRGALVEAQDSAFIDPTNAGSANVKPASIANGATVIGSTGNDADAVRLDVRAVFQPFIDAENPPETGVWIMSTTTALALSLMLNALGQKEFPDITMMGGRFMGLPVITSSHAGNYVVLVNASDIYEADEGEVEVDMSTEASLEMKDSGLTQDATDGTGVAMVSLWQSGLAGLRATKTINWARRRASAVAYLTGVQWGGEVPNS